MLEIKQFTPIHHLHSRLIGHHITANADACCDLVGAESRTQADDLLEFKASIRIGEEEDFK